ncbi:MAG: hypothetical protein H0X17_12105, partial [Deltaproteobacteria bacterium]|nr:hypothetical protein [Deltaproteobacteria bacterium]
LVADLAWAARLEPAPAGPRATWVAGWGVRYQALAWGSIELVVRHREDAGLGGTSVAVRLHGSWDLR